ncbi:hypothetical protein THAOC_02145, partial [Thalassiosira oceanica]
MERTQSGSTQVQKRQLHTPVSCPFILLDTSTVELEMEFGLALDIRYRLKVYRVCQALTFKECLPYINPTKFYYCQATRWPSGLRRCVKAAVFWAWVQIPLESFCP